MRTAAGKPRCFILIKPLINMTIKYNTPIEVNFLQYIRLMRECAGIVAGQQKDGKYYIKVWLMRYKDEVKRILGWK